MDNTIHTDADRLAPEYLSLLCESILSKHHEVGIGRHLADRQMQDTDSAVNSGHCLHLNIVDYG